MSTSFYPSEAILLGLKRDFPLAKQNIQLGFISDWVDSGFCGINSINFRDEISQLKIKMGIWRKKYVWQYSRKTASVLLL